MHYEDKRAGAGERYLHAWLLAVGLRGILRSITGIAVLLYFQLMTKLNFRLLRPDSLEFPLHVR